MNAYLTTMTVKTLREIAKTLGLRGQSGLRKAAIVENIVRQIDMDHEAAIKMNTPKISLMDYPVPYGRPVTEAHVKICQTRGHVSYVKDGIDQGMCPRCGEITTSEEQIEFTSGISSEIGILASKAGYEIKVVKGAMPYEIYRPGSFLMSMNFANIGNLRTYLTDSEEKEMDANSAVIEIANSGINALTPVLATAKATFEGIRDKGTDEEISIAYQIYCDITRAMEEMARTIAYAQNV